MRILFLSHTVDGGPFKVGSHHLARELSIVGNAVHHISTPVTIGHLLKCRSSLMRQRFKVALSAGYLDEFGVRHQVPITFSPFGRDVLQFGRCNARAAVWSAQDLRRDYDLIFLDQPAFAPLLDCLKFAKLIYRPTDAHFKARERYMELRILARAAGIVATSASTLNAVTESAGAISLPSLILPNGVDLAALREDLSPDANGACYVGAIDERFCWESVVLAARALPTTRIHLAGPVYGRVPGGLPDNVSVLGAVKYSDLGRFLSGYRVGLLPMNAHPGNLSRSPMKYYEYLGAGLQVVATAKDELVRRGAVPGVALANSPQHFANLLTWALSTSETYDIQGGRAWAAKESWSTKAQQLLNFSQGLKSPALPTLDDTGPAAH